MTDVLALGLGSPSCTKQELWRYMREAKRMTSFWRYRTDGFDRFGVDCEHVLELPLTHPTIRSFSDNGRIDLDNWSDVRSVLAMARPRSAFIAVVHLGTKVRPDEVVAKEVVHCRTMSEFVDVPLAYGEARTMRVR